MHSHAKVDLSTSPPTINFPREYNAAVEFIDRHLEEGRGDRTALIDDAGSYTYRELAEQTHRAGNVLRELGAGMETRVMLCMLDTVDFPSMFWGAIRAGIVIIPVNTLLTTQEYDYMLRDSRARILVVSDALYEKFAPILDDQPFLETVVVSGTETHGHRSMSKLMSAASPSLETAATVSDDIAFWLYTSGSTGKPKGAMHLHNHLVVTAVLYGLGVLGIRADDVVFSAAKLFFAYGLGNSMTFPFYVGATAVLMAGRPTPDSVMDVLGKHEPTVYYGVPTLYSAILNDPDSQRFSGSPRLRVCVSAGEALPKDLGEGWRDRFGVDILDGLGSTELLHIFLSNRIGAVRYGTSGTPVPGYELKVLDDRGGPASPGEIGELWVRGASAAIAYWNQRAKSLDTFHGPWTRTGDKYIVDADGYYNYCGRVDDMLKVSGQWVSPFEVESALLAHESVLEAAVVGQKDQDDLVKPKGYVVLREGIESTESLSEELKEFVKSRLAPFKYPRWIEFIDTLPKTATGKIQRFKLRQN